MKSAIGSAVGAYFVRLASMPHKHGRSNNGIATPSLLRRGCRLGKSDGGCTTNAAHIAAFVESADSRSRGRGGHATPDAKSSRYRPDARGPRFPRSRTRGAITG